MNDIHHIVRFASYLLKLIRTVCIVVKTFCFKVLNVSCNGLYNHPVVELCDINAFALPRLILWPPVFIFHSGMTNNSKYYYIHASQP